MLKRLGPSATLAANASSPALFPSKLEFNAPAHGTWNIVHIGMLVPEAHQIYVCAINCMRGVVLTAAEMGAQDRFSCVMLKEEDIVRGTVEQITLDGIADVLRKLPKLPPCVIVFPVCTHLFLGINMAHVYRELEREFPQVDFVRAFMDPISKRRLVPDKRLRKVMYDPLPQLPTDQRLVVLLGSDFAPDADCDLRKLLADGGLSLRSIHDCATYDDFRGLGAARLFVSTYPGGDFGAQRTARRLGRPCLYLPGSFSYAQIEQHERMLCEELGLPAPTGGHFAREAALCERALDEARAQIGSAPIALDALAHPRPLGLARLLLSHGFEVREVYLDAVNPEEAEELDWLREHAPSVELSSTVLPELRVAPRTRDATYLAIGQRAAWFCGTDRFVNLVQGGGLWGFAGIRTLAALMADAWEKPKDPRDLLPRKGLGCPSCI